MKTSFIAGTIALASALALAACGSGTADTDGDGTVSADEIQAELESNGGRIRPEPGKYQATMSFVKADIPGAPQEMIDMMSSAMNRTFDYCLTQEDADKGFEEALTEGQDENCTVQKFELNSGDVDMAMTCDTGEGNQMAMTMTGKVTSTSSDITVVTNGTVPEMGEANIEMSMKQERIGECD